MIVNVSHEIEYSGSTLILIQWVNVIKQDRGLDVVDPYWQ